MDIIHLHVHDAFGSLLDSTIRPEELPKKAKELGMNAVAITNHGYMSSMIKFYKACKAEGVKPIIGCELYVCDDIEEKNPDSRYDHLVVLAKNQQGLKNLLKLSSLGFTQGFYYKPRVDWKLLEAHKEGLVVMTACLGGTLPRLILQGKHEEAKEWVCHWKKVFPDFYLEIQGADNEEQAVVNTTLVRMAAEYGVPLVATSDIHFLEKEDFELHKVFIEIATERDNEVYYDCWFKTEEEMMAVFQKQGIDFFAAAEAIANTHVIADMCNVELELGNHYLPHFPIPKGFSSENEYLRHLINRGVVKRGIDKFPPDKRKVYIDRLKYEYDIITKMGFAGYFLILWDFLAECRRRGILTGDGRGSACSSLVCYVLEITNVDSIKFGLDFTRFLTLGRVSLPDVDTDISSSRKAEAVNILREKYGQENVAQICTFMTMKAKAILESVGKVFDIPLEKIVELKDYIGAESSLADALEQSPELKQAAAQYPKYFEACLRLEGLPKTISVHAGGVVIVPNDREMADFTAIALGKSKEAITQLDMEDIEEAGLVKMDVLGVATIDVIQDCLDLIYGKGE